MITRWLVYHVASGQAFFTGAACLIVAVAMAYRTNRPCWRGILELGAFLGGMLVFLSATPLAPWAYLILSFLTIAWLIGEQVRPTASRRIVPGLRATVATAWLAAVLVEVPYHVMPRVPPLGNPVLGIIADSVTAGMGQPGVTTWPTLFAGRYGVTVRDHSQMGATVASAWKQAAELSSEERLVLLEIGGNDLLGVSTPREFEAGLEKLLEVVERSGRVIVMLELPLLPSYNAFGRIQRRLARSHRVILVPKRVLLDVLERGGATVDTIHLSQEGHHAMSDRMWAVVRDAYEHR